MAERLANASHGSERVGFYWFASAYNRRASTQGSVSMIHWARSVALVALIAAGTNLVPGERGLVPRPRKMLQPTR
jgi:hypothetical protein